MAERGERRTGGEAPSGSWTKEMGDWEDLVSKPHVPPHRTGTRK